MTNNTNVFDYSKKFTVEAEDIIWTATYGDFTQQENENGGLTIKYGKSILVDKIFNYEIVAEFEEKIADEEIDGRHTFYGNETEYIEEVQEALDKLNKYFEQIDKTGYFGGKDVLDPNLERNYGCYIFSGLLEDRLPLDEYHEIYEKVVPPYEDFCSRYKG